MRQVAGLVAYFKEAPAFVNNTKVAKITVSTKAKVNAFYFPASLLDNSIYERVFVAEYQQYKKIKVQKSGKGETRYKSCLLR